MIAALLLAGLGVLAPAATDTTFVIESGGRAVIEHAEGDIEVRGVAGREARVLIDGRSRGARVSRSGSVHYIGAGAFWQDAGASLLVELPRDVKVVIHGLDGDVRVDGMTAGVEIDAIDGSIRVSGGTSVAAQTVDGRIHVDGASTVWAQTGDGDIRLERVRGPIEAQTIDGDAVVLASESDRVSLSTISGDVWYEGRLAPRGEYALESHDGNVVLAVPRGTGARISATVFDGEIAPSFPVELHRRSGGTTELTIGDGGARVRLQTFDGEIRLIRPGERSPGPG